MSLSPQDPSAKASPGVEPRAAVTINALNRMAGRGEPFACLACYDATTARWLERAGVHLLLAGDSAAQVVLGHERTIDAPLDFMVQITAAVKRGAPRTVVMADMPFMSYHASVEQAMSNAARFMIEGMADVIKLETDGSFGPLVERLTSAGVPVCAHIGFRPQTTGLLGVPRARGRTGDDQGRVVEDAVALEQAGAVLLLVECVPPETTRAILEATSVPLIGIGAGTDCHGQILVVNDLVGLTDAPPRFAEPVGRAGPAMLEAGKAWVDRVARGEIGGTTYRMKDAKDAPRTGHSKAKTTGRSS